MCNFQGSCIGNLPKFLNFKKIPDKNGLFFLFVHCNFSVISSLLLLLDLVYYRVSLATPYYFVRERKMVQEYILRRAIKWDQVLITPRLARILCFALVVRPNLEVLSAGTWCQRASGNFTFVARGVVDRVVFNWSS